jgi:hypothetical protein
MGEEELGGSRQGMTGMDNFSLYILK